MGWKICEDLEHDISLKPKEEEKREKEKKNRIIKKPQAEFFFRCVPFLQLPIKKISYIFCSFRLKHVREKETYFLFIFSLLVLYFIFAGKLISWWTLYTVNVLVHSAPSTRHSRINVLNVDFAHFDTIRFVSFAGLLDAVCNLYSLSSSVGVRKNIYGKIIIICLFPQGKHSFLLHSLDLFQLSDPLSVADVNILWVERKKKYFQKLSWHLHVYCVIFGILIWQVSLLN